MHTREDSQSNDVLDKKDESKASEKKSIWALDVLDKIWAVVSRPLDVGQKFADSIDDICRLIVAIPTQIIPYIFGSTNFVIHAYKLIKSLRTFYKALKTQIETQKTQIETQIKNNQNTIKLVASGFSILCSAIGVGISLALLITAGVIVGAAFLLAALPLLMLCISIIELIKIEKQFPNLEIDEANAEIEFLREKVTFEKNENEYNAIKKQYEEAEKKYNNEINAYLVKNNLHKEIIRLKNKIEKIKRLKIEIEDAIKTINKKIENQPASDSAKQALTKCNNALSNLTKDEEIFSCKLQKIKDAASKECNPTHDAFLIKKQEYEEQRNIYSQKKEVYDNLHKKWGKKAVVLSEIGGLSLVFLGTVLSNSGIIATLAALLGVSAATLGVLPIILIATGITIGVGIKIYENREKICNGFVNLKNWFIDKFSPAKEMTTPPSIYSTNTSFIQHYLYKHPSKISSDYVKETHFPVETFKKAGTEYPPSSSPSSLFHPPSEVPKRDDGYRLSFRPTH